MSKKATPSGSPNASSEPTPMDAAAPTNDMFGGMSVTRKPKKSKKSENADPAPAAAVKEETKSEKTEEGASSTTPSETRPEPAPFKFNWGSQQPANDVVEDAELTRIRRRLECFYGEYNTAKLAHIDQTLQVYSGKEKELFEALVKKYGPEPKGCERYLPGVPQEVQAAAPTTATAAPATQSNASVDPEELVQEAEEGFGANDGWGADSAAVPDGGATGFTFGEDAPAGTGFTFAEAPLSGAAGSAFGFVSAPEGAPASNATAFAFVSEPAQDAAPQDSSPKPTESEEKPKSQEREKSENQEDDSGPAQSLNEKLTAQLMSVKALAAERCTAMADTMRHIARAVHDRVGLVSQYHAIEQEIEVCIAKEDYIQAEQLNEKLGGLGKQIDEIDEDAAVDLSNVARYYEEVDKATKNVATTLLSQRSTLVESRAEEERKVNRFVSETAHHLEQLGERVRADLDRATRTMNNITQEIVNLNKREEKIQEKIQEQSKELRASRTTTAEKKTVLENEIRELEKKLALKRRSLAEVNAELADTDQKLKVISDDNAQSISDVQKQKAEENTKLIEASGKVDALSAERDKLLQEEIVFKRNAEKMKSELQDNAAKISEYLTASQHIETKVSKDNAEFFATVFECVVAARSAGRAFFCPMPHNPQAAAVSQSLLDLESQDKQVEAEVQDLTSSISSLVSRVQDLSKSIPILEAAKKAAAAAKQFKEAAAKTEEIKRSNEEKAKCEKEQKDAAQKIEALKQKKMEIGKQKEQAEAKAREKMAAVIVEYSRLLEAAGARCLRPTLVEDVVKEAANAEEGCNPFIAEAAREMLRALVEELKAADSSVVIELPQPREATPPVEDAAQAAAPEELSPPAAEPAAEPAATSTVPQRTNEEIDSDIAELEKEQEAAAAQDDFDKCEELQKRIDELKNSKQK